uniref:Required for excision 1-B domain containing n=1 Tax=Loxodonta africana TaxID=9785 RepID=G3T1N5_LOXAF
VMITAEEAASAPGLPGRTEPVWPWKGAPVHALVQRIHQLQAERAQAFRRLEEAHRQYVRSGPHYDFPRYRGSVHKVTQAFAAASREVLALEAELAGPRAQPLLAGHVRALQQLEQTRLATVSSKSQGTPTLFQAPIPSLSALPLWVIKTMEAISKVLQDLRFDAESVE